MSAARELPGRSRRIPVVPLLAAFVAGVALAGIAGAAALLAYDRHYAARILPGVSVGAVDVSGLERDVARERLRAAYGALGEGRLVVVVGDRRTVVRYRELARQPDLERMLDEAFAVGRSPSQVRRVVDEMRLLTEGLVLAPRMTFDPSLVAQRLTEIARASEWRPVDAHTIRTETGFSTRRSKPGQRVDEAAAIQRTISALARTDAPSEIVVELPTVAIEPRITDAEAQRARARAATTARPVVVVAGDETWAIPASAIHRAVSFQGTANGTIEPVVNRTLILAAVRSLAAAIDRPAVDATFAFDRKAASFTVGASVDGRAFLADATAEGVLAILRARTLGLLRGDQVRAVLSAVKPELTTEQATAAVGRMRKVSSWTTKYVVQESNGFGANIRLPGNFLDGYVVGPGETFDFWTALGPVTRERGFRDGGAIIDGRTQPTGALAGGICTVSTTLFNAAARAGFEIVERAAHYYYIDRYPLGLDATVLIRNGAVTSMKWRNDTRFPVLIRGVNGPKTGASWIRFEVYTVPLGRTVTFSEPIVKDVRKATTVIEYTSELPPGTRKQIEYPHDGKKVWVTRTVVDDATGAVLYKDTFGSAYGVVDGVILVGQAGAGPAEVTVGADGGTDTETD